MSRRVLCSARPRPFRSRRGSVLIVTLVLAAIIGISLASYIKLSLNSLTLADRSFYQTAALNLAEQGLEEAMYCFNRLDNVTTKTEAWAAVTNAATGATITWAIAGDNSVSSLFPSVTLGPGVTGQVKVYASHYNPSGSNPTVLARARVTPQQGPVLEKWIRITLRKRSLFANGMVARNGVTWKGGNSSADSWNSEPDNDPSAGTPAAYGSTAGPARANATVASKSGSVSVAGGTIRGRVATGGGGISHSSGAILSSTTTGTGWDITLESTDFDATFPIVTVPTPPTANKNLVSGTAPIDFPSTLPRTGDVAWNGVYYYEFSTGWGLSSSGSASKIVTIDGDIVFLATNHSGTNVIDLGGNASINVVNGKKLTIYTNGNIEAAGNGITNANPAPSSMQIFGTHTTAGGQTIRFVGNGASSAAIYAPNATFELKGNGSLSGAVIADNITMNGNASFHYDEALSNLSNGNPFGIVSWKEVQDGAERATLASTVAF